MTGFIGSWHAHGLHPTTLPAGLAAIRHRGPHGEHWLEHGCLRVGLRRLEGSERPGQPPALAREGAWLRLAEDSSHATTGFDLPGRFAWAHSDGDNLVLARDPLGISPLYWSPHGGGLLFASEIKALLPVAPAETIKAFPPGHAYTTATGIVPIWRLPAGWSSTQAAGDGDRVVDTFMATLERAVRVRLSPDLPVGVLLSGGVDSSLIAALAHRHRPDLHTFSVGLPGSSDLQQARLVAAHLGTIHHEVVINARDALAALDQVIWHLESWDPDLVANALPSWFLARETARHVAIVLSGDGADELFAGYPYHRDYDGPHLHRELRRSLKHLHHVNLQRVDRMSRGHGLQVLMPMLDGAVVALALNMPPDQKLTEDLDKLVVRQAAARLLPAGIAWRAKEQIDQGSGMAAALQEHGLTPLRQLEQYRASFSARFPAPCDWLVAGWRQARLRPTNQISRASVLPRAPQH